MGGGFTLAKSPARLRILESVQAVDPIQRITNCPLGLAAHGKHLCPLHRRLDDALAAMEKAFAVTTLEEVLAEPSRGRPLCDFPVPPSAARAESRPPSPGDEHAIPSARADGVPLPGRHPGSLRRGRIGHRRRVRAAADRVFRLEHDARCGYLPAVLDALGVPRSSQALVFSKTSLQQQKIGPRNPRALYFNDEVYVSYVRSGEVVELSVADPGLGHAPRQPDLPAAAHGRCPRGQGRSLRDFDLATRLFRHPCSFRVYSASFAALPEELRTRFWKRMHAVLAGTDQSGRFGHLMADDRTAIREILAATKPVVPAARDVP